MKKIYYILHIVLFLGFLICFCYFNPIAAKANRKMIVRETEQKCYVCKGSGDCTRCSGTRKVECTKCDGTGKVEKVNPWNHEEPEKCGKCNGTGEMKCSSCNGSGNCSKCSGTGKLDY